MNNAITTHAQQENSAGYAHHAPTYNHAYSLIFSLSGSQHPNGEGDTPAQLKAALLKRIEDLDNSPGRQEWLEAIGDPTDTYEEAPAEASRPITCPRCGGTEISAVGEDIHAGEKPVEPQSGCTLDEYQCHDCDGAAFWL